MPLIPIDSTSSTMNEITGICALFNHRLASTASAISTAIQNRMVLAGSDALTSV